MQLFFFSLVNQSHPCGTAVNSSWIQKCENKEHSCFQNKRCWWRRTCCFRKSPFFLQCWNRNSSVEAASNNMKKHIFTVFIFVTVVSEKNAAQQHKERHHHKFPDYQRTHWYSLTSPTDTVPSSGDYVDYHLAPDPAPAPAFSSTISPLKLRSEVVGNVSSQLGQTVYLKCTVMGFRQGLHTVSWTKKTL